MTTAAPDWTTLPAYTKPYVPPPNFSNMVYCFAFQVASGTKRSVKLANGGGGGGGEGGRFRECRNRKLEAKGTATEAAAAETTIANAAGTATEAADKAAGTSAGTTAKAAEAEASEATKAAGTATGVAEAAKATDEATAELEAPTSGIQFCTSKAAFLSTRRFNQAMAAA